jgi:site-specific recombinase XerD
LRLGDSTRSYRHPTVEHWHGLITDLEIAIRIAGTALGRTDIRIHDLRHTYASILVSSGLSLPVIGALLGHTQASTTHRYAHLFDEPLRAATERVAEIVQIKTRAA